MKQHATKMGKRTAFHAEAERVRLLNQNAATTNEIYYADAMLKEIKRLAKNSRSRRRDVYLRSFARKAVRLNNQINVMLATPHFGDELDRLELWRKMLERDDDRAYGAVRSGVVDPADFSQWRWWCGKIIEGERFSIVEMSSPVKSERNRLKKIFGF